MSDIRDEFQEKAKQAWWSSDRQSTLILPTGSGKSLVAIDILKEIIKLEGTQNVLILSNSEQLRDTNWKNEFVKWGLETYWEDCVQSETYQKMYKDTSNKSWDLIIYDELDFAVSEQYSKTFNLAAKYKLGLTGFITEDKEKILNTYLPICFKANVQALQEQGILNKSEFIIINYPLSTEKTIEQATKKGTTFRTSENDLYKYWDKQFQQATIVKTQIEKRYRLLNQNFELEKDWQAASWKFKISATKRKALLHSADSTIKLTKNLIAHIHSREGNKALIFTTLTKQADKLPNPFHGKSETDTSGIERLNSGEITTMSVVKKVTRGVNLVGVNYLVRAYFDGSETDLSQSLGRLLRLRVEQLAKYVILVPTYTDLVKTRSGAFERVTFDTQANRWKDKMMQSLVDPTIRTITVDKDLIIKTGITI